jgi:hypothetical protein
MSAFVTNAVTGAARPLRRRRVGVFCRDAFGRLAAGTFVTNVAIRATNVDIRDECRRRRRRRAGDGSVVDG